MAPGGDAAESTSVTGASKGLSTVASSSLQTDIETTNMQTRGAANQTKRKKVSKATKTSVEKLQESPTKKLNINTKGCKQKNAETTSKYYYVRKIQNCRKIGLIRKKRTNKAV